MQTYEQGNWLGSVVAVRNAGAQQYLTGLTGFTEYDAYGIATVQDDGWPGRG